MLHFIVFKFIAVVGTAKANSTDVAVGIAYVSVLG